MSNDPKQQKRIRNPFNLTYGDGWRFGMGFFLAAAIGMPILMCGAGVVLWFVVTVLGVGAGILGG